MVIRSESENLLKMSEGLVHIILVVEAETANEDGVHVGAVLTEQIVGNFLGFAVAAEIGQTFGPKKFEAARGCGNFEGSVKAEESLK